MRIAVLSDVHANLPALEAVLAHLKARSDLDAVYHLGDLVGYAPWPNECVHLLRDEGITGVAGNYDSTVAHDHEHCGCRYESPEQEALAHRSYEWTRAQVLPETRRALAALPFRIDLRPRGGHRSKPTITLLHGAPTLNTVYWTEDRPERFHRQMIERVHARDGDVVVFGHTHKPWRAELDGVTLVNAGSVGRPKDGDERACYLTIDAEDLSVAWERVPYDVERAARAIRESALPDDFAIDLETGMRKMTALRS